MRMRSLLDLIVRPSAKRVESGFEPRAGFGQSVLDPGVLLNLLHDSALLELTQPLGEHSVREPRDCVDEFGESHGTLEHDVDDLTVPPFAQKRENSINAATRMQNFPLHKVTIGKDLSMDSGTKSQSKGETGYNCRE